MESEKVEKMNEISKQVEELRKSAKLQHDIGFRNTENLMLQVADTIEILSAKLQAVNGDRWIPCSERLPENKDNVLVRWGANNISIGYFVDGGAGGWFFEQLAGGNKIPYEPHEWKTLDENIASIIAHEPKINKWIPCVEKKPKENEEVMLTFKNSIGLHVGEATYKHDMFFYITDTAFGYYEEVYKNPIAWMPKLKPYNPQ